MTDKRRQEIIADYIECGSYRETAKRFQISPNTVKHYVQKGEQVAQRCAEKKEENARDVLACMEEKKDKACLIIDTYLNRMLDEEVIKKMNGTQLATSLAIIIDKFSAVNKDSSAARLDKLCAAIREATK